MSRARRAVLALAVALAAACVVSVPAVSAADVVLPFTNYKVGGSLTVKKLRLGLLSVPTTCRTSEPIQLTLNYDGPLAYPLNFNGTTTIPSLTGCGLLGPTLGTLLSGPGNAYHVTLGPP